MKKDAKELILADAIETAIRAERENIKLKRWVLVLSILCIVLSIICLYGG